VHRIARQDLQKGQNLLYPGSVYVAVELFSMQAVDQPHPAQMGQLRFCLILLLQKFQKPKLPNSCLFLS
jgi:hypothetical protein